MKRCLMNHSIPLHPLEEAALQVGAHAVAVSVDPLRLVHDLQLLAVVGHLVCGNDERLPIFRQEGGRQRKESLVQISYG